MSRDQPCDRLSAAVGETPLVRLRRAVPGFPGEVLAKLEYLNPMGSVKDRIARFIVEKAVAEGRLRAGDTLIEASSGNTAMGLAMMAIMFWPGVMPTSRNVPSGAVRTVGIGSRSNALSTQSGIATTSNGAFGSRTSTKRVYRPRLALTRNGRPLSRPSSATARR